MPPGRPAPPRPPPARPIRGPAASIPPPRPPPGWVARTSSTGPGQTFSPPVTITSAIRPKTARVPSSSIRPPSPGGEPAVVQPGVGAVPVGRGAASARAPAPRRRAPTVPSPMRSSTPSRAGRRRPAGAGLGHAVGGDDVGRERRRGAPRRPAARTGSPRRRSGPSAVATSDTSVAPARASSSTAAGSNRSSTVHGCPGDQRAGDHRQPADVGQGQAGQPAVAARVDGQAGPRWRRPRRSPSACVWTTPLGSPVVPLVATTRASPGSSDWARREPVGCPSGDEDPGRPEGVEQALDGWPGEPADRSGARRRRHPRWPAGRPRRPGRPARSSATNSPCG